MIKNIDNADIIISDNNTDKKNSGIDFYNENKELISDKKFILHTNDEEDNLNLGNTNIIYSNKAFTNTLEKICKKINEDFKNSQQLVI